MRKLVIIGSAFVAGSAWGFFVDHFPPYTATSLFLEAAGAACIGYILATLTIEWWR